MLKKYTLSLLLLIISTFFTCQSENHQQKFNASNVVIAWDFHGVLVKKDWQAMNAQIFSIIKSDWKLVGLLFWPPFWKLLYNTLHICGTSEELLVQITNQYPSLKPHWNKLLMLINLHVPIPKSVEILKNLKEHGYLNYLTSNIGPESYEIQKGRFPEIFEQFEGHYIPKNRDGNTGLLIGKPCVEYYVELRDYLGQQESTKNKSIIFIDDKKINIQGAIDSNHQKNNQIYGIVFTLPQQLEVDLNNLVELKVTR